ncbi:MAG TPA: molybdopterin cofactor-binding domain-containing protein [Chloroflexia bacterium]|nr:molybdopterin cofactor-binding domain-containing protein [Chloroflexia bacterium]
MASANVGASVQRHEDPKLITGAGTYVDDIKLPGMLYVGIVRSPHAHARITRIDVEAARRHPRAKAVITGQEVRARQKAPLPISWRIPPDIQTPDHWAMATEKVHYVGEPVAAVLVDDRYAIEDVMDLVEVDYEPLPAVTGPEQALAAGAPLIHEELGTNKAYTFSAANGDTDAAFSTAPVVVKQRLINQRLAPVSLETRGIVAQYNYPMSELTMWSSTQTPHITRTHVAEMLGLPENKVRVIAPDVGGGFGSKLNILPEDFIVPLLAVIGGHPVKWIEGRSENLMNTVHGRDMVDAVEIAADQDGTIRGVRATIYADLGAYCRFFAAGLPVLAGLMLPGNYKIPAFKVDIHVAYTNKLFVDAYRGAGRPEATYAIERIMDLLADELKMDPAELRRKNFVQAADWPYTSPTGLAYDSGNYGPLLDKMLTMTGYADLRRQYDAHNAPNPAVRKGIGLAAYVEIAGWGPGQATKGFGVANQLFGSATVRVNRSGTVEVLSGASGHGQGHATSWAQIAADQLGISHTQVSVIEGDTAMIQTGTGTFASRSVSVDGAGVHIAAKRIHDKMLQIAAHQLEAAAEDLEIVDGQITVKGVPGRAVSFQQVAYSANVAHDLPPGLEPGLEETAFFDPANFTYPFGVHLATVDVDTETGETRITRYLAVDDCGNVINPMIVDGQVHGGVAQGVAQALWEEVVYDEHGQLISGTLMDYGVPLSSDLPMIETGSTVTPSPVNPLGVKGVGEAGTIAATPVIVNAVMDALSGLGVRHIDMPLRPEKVWRAIRDQSGPTAQGGTP